MYKIFFIVFILPMQRILAFIEYFNQTLAKPYRWTYIGKPLLE